MNTRKKVKKLALGAVVAVAGLLANRAYAVTPAFVNIDVQITASLSVSVNGAGTSTDTVNWSPTAREMSGSSVTVRNDSGGLTEGWKLATNAQSIDTTGGGAAWTLVPSTAAADVGADQFALQAMFASSATAASGALGCPAYNAADWTAAAGVADVVTTGGGNYTSSAFVRTSDPAGNPLPDNGTNKMYAYDGGVKGFGQRALCWKVIGPTSSATTNKQNVQIIVSATP